MNIILALIFIALVNYAGDTIADELKNAYRDCAECPEMVTIPDGQFMMGSISVSNNQASDGSSANSTGEFEELPRHRVQVNSFALGKYEVTQEQWIAIMGNNPSVNQGPTLPVENISWEDAQDFIRKLSEKTGMHYRLPSESEWEFAARSDSFSQFFFGDDPAELEQYAWYEKNSEGKSHPVGLKKPNRFGLFDMLGNVWERTEDCWNIDYDGAPHDGSAWTTGDCTRRVVRGGSWVNLSQFHRSAYRFRYSPTSRYEFIGLRVARSN